MAMSSFFSVIPRSETGSKDHVEVEGLCDGSGVIIGIMDTGVDPGASGLQTTPSGKPKIVDIVDCSGSGDVDTSTVRKMDENRCIKGRTDRILRVPNDWPCSDNTEFHLGILNAWRVFPKKLVKRLLSERKKEFLVQNRTIHARLLNDREEARKLDDQDKVDELNLLIDQLDSFRKHYNDNNVGPIFDVLVFKNDNRWQAALDTSETGDLTSANLMGEYRFDQEFSMFGDELLSYSFNVYDNGNTLSVVTNAGSHGTHVASICAGYYPEKPDLNGVAPGAQIVSMKIGDTRLGSMETGPALMRAMICVLRSGCHLVNMSYGEASSHANTGRFIDMLSDVVYKHGVTFVASAGNAGPALSTVGAPGGTSSCAISVGAYVSSEMMQTHYSMRESLADMQTTWSSRGPTFDGDLGVTVSAPGAAIASVPSWTLNHKQLMNGTSMSSPNACGVIALMLSEAQKRGVKTSPQRIRHAIENTAIDIPGVEKFALGHGLIQLRLALEHLFKHADDPLQDIPFKVSVQGGGRGILLREETHVRSQQVRFVSVTPILTSLDENKYSSNRAKFELEIHAKITCDSSWVSCPESVVICSDGRNFEVLVDPTGLEPGAHFTEVIGYSVKCEGSSGQGALFRVPITVIKPLETQTNAPHFKFDSLSFTPGALKRKFIHVPVEANLAVIRVQCLDTSLLENKTDAHVRRFVVHCLQHHSARSHSETAYRKYLDMKGTREQLISVPVRGAHALEVCVAQFWSSLGTSNISLDIIFHGLIATPSHLHLRGPEPCSVFVQSHLQSENFKPSASLTHWTLPLRPVFPMAQPRCLSSSEGRDTLPDERHIFEIVMQYELMLKESGKIIVEVPLLNRVLYESPYESQMLMIFDESKRCQGISDAWPKQLSLEKGKYTLRLQVRHDDPVLLERLSQLQVFIKRRMTKSISIECYNSIGAAITGKDPCSNTSSVLHCGDRKNVFLALDDNMNLPKGYTSECQLHGHLSLDSDASSDLPGSGFRQQKVPITVSSFIPRKSDPGGKDPSIVKKTEEEKHSDSEVDKAAQFREGVLSWLGKLPQNKLGQICDYAIQQVQVEGGELSCAALRLKSLSLEDDGADVVVKAADQVIALCDVDDLAKQCGVKQPTGRESAELRKSIADRKKTLIEALHQKCKALLAYPDDQKRSELDEAMATFRKWADASEGNCNSDFVYASAAYDFRRGRVAAALSVLNKHDRIALVRKELNQLRIEILSKLEWYHQLELLHRRYLLSNSDMFAPF